MYKRLIDISVFGNKSFFLFGPRGTGKTFWVKYTFKDGLYFDLLESDIYLDLRSSPRRLDDLIPQGFDGWIILDEVQRVPNLLNEVHRLIESKNYKFVLTGSSARSLRRTGVNLLAGRALTYKLHPLTVQELGEDFVLKNSLQYGHLPSVPHEHDPKSYMESYVSTYVREEVLQEGLIRNLSAFSRFLEVASFSQGGVLNLSQVAREANVGRKAVEGYFLILEDLLIAYRLPVFSKRAKRRVVSHPKFYFFDVGVFRAIRPMGYLDSPEEAEGAALETLVFQELLAINDYLGLEYNLFYWRTSNQIEVDFVLYGPKGLLAFEVKRAGKVSNKDLNGLKAFSRDYPEAKLYFLYGGRTRRYHGNINVIPIEDALRELPKILGNDEK